MNQEETSFKDFMEQRGFKVYRNGWPDFLVVSDGGETFAVEVKGRPGGVPPEQRAMHSALRLAGIKTYIVRRATFEKLVTEEGRKNVDDKRQRYMSAREPLGTDFKRAMAVLGR